MGLLDRFFTLFREKEKPKPQEGPVINTLNLMVTDICNSRCVFCNVWKKKKAKEISPGELSRILQDPLFGALKYVGVSGGEPTLRSDLADIFRAIADKEGVKGTGIITNALNAEQVIARVEESRAVCKDKGVAFNIMVSLDGIGGVHDRIRGREGNFEKALRVIRHFRDNTDIPLSIGCTIVKDNVWHLDEVLDFCREEKVYGAFRVGEFIDRLYNSDLVDNIRNFDRDERYQIALFYIKLEKEYEKARHVLNTYRSLRKMIFEGAPRQGGCSYRLNSVGLNAAGELLYCSPKSPLLGSCIDTSAKTLYREKRHLLESIKENHCDNCVHYHHSPPLKGSVEELKDEQACIKAFSVIKALEGAAPVQSALPSSPQWSGFKAPLIIGWYGTETAGDKAILWDIIDRLKAASPAGRITVASLYPFVTARTLYELGLGGVGAVKTFSSDYLESCAKADAVIMGGGPLMGLGALGFVLAAFSEARKHGTPTIIEGCGIGPLARPEHISAVKEILRLANQIKLRDRASLEWVKKETGRDDALCSKDPALRFVRNWSLGELPPETPPAGDYFACFFRELPTGYETTITPEQYGAFRGNFEKELGRLLIYLHEKTGLKPYFVPMHTFTVGNDDRDFARRFAKLHLKGQDHIIGNRVYSPGDILSVMKMSRFNLCMRYHSVLFADTLQTPYLAIDYTGGGKIKGFLRDRGQEELMLDRARLAEGDWEDKAAALLSGVARALS